MAFDTKQWLTDLGFTEAEIGELAPKFETRADSLEKNQLRQADFSRAQDALKKQQEEVATLKAQEEQYINEWATLTATEKATGQRLRVEKEQAEARALALTQRLTRMAEEAGLDPKKALEGIDHPPPKKEDPPPIDTSQFVRGDQLGTISSYLFGLIAELPMLAQEHFDLTGERLDTRALRAKIEEQSKQKGANLDPRALWESTYNIPEKRATKAKQEREAELAAAEKRGYDKARTEQALPVPPSTGMNSPLLRTVDGQPRESILKRPQPEQGVRKAAEAIASGKYREQPHQKAS